MPHVETRTYLTTSHSTSLLLLRAAFWTRCMRGFSLCPVALSPCRCTPSAAGLSALLIAPYLPPSSLKLTSSCNVSAEIAIEVRLAPSYQLELGVFRILLSLKDCNTFEMSEVWWHMPSQPAGIINPRKKEPEREDLARLLVHCLLPGSKASGGLRLCCVEATDRSTAAMVST